MRKIGDKLIRYVINRVILLIPVIIAVSFIVFTLIELAPGDVVDQWATGEMTQEELAALKAKYDLDKPMLYRYGKYMLNLVQGDLGLSQQGGVPVFDTYMDRLPNTLILTFSGAVIGVALAIPMGIRAARKAGSVTDATTTGFTLVGMSMPQFWLGLLLMLLFSLQLKWLPAGGNQDGIRSLVLPAICSAMTLMAMSARQTRASMLEVLRADFLRTARAKGVPEKRVIRKHALGNALIPVVTIVGTSICVSLAGSVVIEQVFAWPGVGRMLVQGVISRDVTITLGCTIMTTILYVLVMLIVDLLYAFIDPRIKAQYMTKTKKRRTANRAPAKGDARTDGPAGFDPGPADDEPANAALLITQPPPGTGGTAPPEEESSIHYADGDLSKDVSSGGAKDYVTREYGDIAGSDTVVNAAEVMARYKKRSQMGMIWHRLIHNKSSLVGIIILGFIFLIAIISLFMSYDSVISSNISIRFSPPSWEHPFGTDSIGRDTFLRVIYGTRYSIIIGFFSVALSTLVGIILGAVSAYYGKMTDNIIMRASDILASIPGLLLGMVVMVTLGMSLQNLIIAVGIAGIPNFIRMTRASILTVKGNEYIEAARAIGFSDLRIIVTQLLPNGLSPIIVQATTILGVNIIVGSALSFLGFGIPAPTPEWGALISAGREYIRTAPWLATYPGLFIMVTVLGFNLLGDGLRDALDPKLKK